MDIIGLKRRILFKIFWGFSELHILTQGLETTITLLQLGDSNACIFKFLQRN